MTDPVLIVGAGPTGLTAAMELSRMGIDVRLIDKSEGPATTSRAIGVQARTLELFEQRGLAEEMVRLGNKGEAGSVYGGGKRVFRLDFGRVDSRYDYLLFVSQAETERILRKKIRSQGVSVEWKVELEGISQNVLSHDPSPVKAILKHADGRMEQISTPWLISAEGAHSVVRSTLDLQFEGKTLDDNYALGDLHIDGDLSDNDFHIFSSEHGFMGMFPIGSGRFRLIASNPFSKPDKNTEPSLEELQGIYDQRSHIPARFHDLTWSSWFRINSRMVSRLKIGRLLLGGDAAHVHSPAGAQGMNTGIQDMINLSWKLAMVMKGQAPIDLLETYEQDRLPVMHDVLFKTENLTDVIGSENHLVRNLFNHLGPWIGSAGFVQDNSTARMSQVALDYRESPLSEDHGHGGSLKAGDRVPDMPVLHRTETGWKTARLFALLNPSHYTLLVAGPPSDTAPEGLHSSVPEERFVEIAPSGDDDQQATFEDIFGKAMKAILVRPDGYAGLTSPGASAASRVAEYRGKWASAPEAHA